MKLEIIHSDGDDHGERYEAVKYWCNACGELHYHGEYDLTEEELPAPLRRAYKDLWSEGYGSLCYLVDTQDGYGIALLNEYDGVTAEESGTDMNGLFALCVADAMRIANADVFEGAHIYALESSGVDECHELIVVFPADVSEERFNAAADALLKEYAYGAIKRKEAR